VHEKEKEQKRHWKRQRERDLERKKQLQRGKQLHILLCTVIPFLFIAFIFERMKKK